MKAKLICREQLKYLFSYDESSAELRYVGISGEALLTLWNLPFNV